MSGTSVNPIRTSILINSVITCFYVPVFIYFLIYDHKLHHIGKASFIQYMQFLWAAEFIKFIVRYYITSTNVQEKTKTKRHNVVSRKLIEILKVAFVTCATTIAFFIILVLFGAPILSNQEETLMLSILMSSLIIFPTYLHLGWESGNSVLLNLHFTHEDLYARMLQQNIVLTTFGTWLGAVVIPLDWDRPWQEWPIPCCLGALGGYLFSHLLITAGHFFKSVDCISNCFKKTGIGDSSHLALHNVAVPERSMVVPDNTVSFFGMIYNN